jgi:hypothetical protein
MPILILPLLVVELILVMPPPAYSTPAGRIIALDAIAVPNQPVFLEAILYHSGLLGILQPPIGGEVFLFYDQKGDLLGERLTDIGGAAQLPYTGAKPGIYPFIVKLKGTTRCQAEPSEASLFVRNPKQSLFFVAAEETLAGMGSLEFLLSPPEKISPAPDSSSLLNKLQHQYDIVYLTALEKISFGKIRKWLQINKYPKAPLCPAGVSVWKNPDEDAKKFAEAISMVWKDHTYPAYVVVGRKAMTKSLSEKNLKIFLLDHHQESSGEEKKTPCTYNEPCLIHEWKEIEPCIPVGKHP